MSPKNIALRYSHSLHCLDSWDLGILTYEMFNGTSWTTPAAAQTKGQIPQDIFTHYKRLFLPNPNSRLSVTHFLDQGLRAGGFFRSEMITFADAIATLTVKSEIERDAFLQKMSTSAALPQFPSSYVHQRVLPELLKAFEFAGAGSNCLKVILEIGENLPSDDYEKLVLSVLVRMYSSQDRIVRMSLLEALPKYVSHMTPKIVTNNVWPQLASGFLDTVPGVREQTVRAVILIAPLLSDRILNNDLLRALAKTQCDPQPGIRTNTTICLGKIAKHFSQQTHKRVLVIAFAKALKDGFSHARAAGLMALGACIEYFDMEDSAVRIIPAISPLLIDPDQNTRTQASKVLELYLTRVHKLAINIVETTTENTTTSKSPTPQEYSSGFMTSATAILSSFAGARSPPLPSPQNGLLINDMQRSESAPPSAHPVPPPKPVSLSRSVKGMKLQKTVKSPFDLDMDGAYLDEAGAGIKDREVEGNAWGLDDEDIDI